MATRQVPTLPQQYQAGNTLQSQTNGGAWACLVAGLVELAHWDGDQTDGEQAPHGSYSSDEPRFDSASDAPLAAFRGRASAQHVLHRTAEWDRERTACDVNTQSVAMPLSGSRLLRRACT